MKGPRRACSLLLLLGAYAPSLCWWSCSQADGPALPEPEIGRVSESSLRTASVLGRQQSSPQQTVLAQ